MVENSTRELPRSGSFSLKMLFIHLWRIMKTNKQHTNVNCLGIRKLSVKIVTSIEYVSNFVNSSTHLELKYATNWCLKFRSIVFFVGKTMHTLSFYIAILLHEYTIWLEPEDRKKNFLYFVNSFCKRCELSWYKDLRKLKIEKLFHFTNRISAIISLAMPWT